MDTLFSVFKKAAQDAAVRASERVLSLDREIAEFHKQKAKIESARVMARGALQRTGNYPVRNGPDYLCPICWVDEGKMSPLRPIPSQDSHDIFHCGLCSYEVVI